jgi:mannan endo-1,4-beta-mannosidase
MWQLVNEAEVKPSAESSSCSVNASALLRAFASDVSARIKGIDPNHLVSLGTIGGGQCGASGDEYADVHSLSTIDLCEYHDYGSPSVGIPGDQWNGLQRRLDQCAALAKPLLVGELGIRPTEVGGTFQARAEAVDSKLCAQFTAGVAGELLWAWNKDGSLLDNFDIGPNDPVLGTLAPWTNADRTCGTTAVRIHSFFARREGRTTPSEGAGC